MDDYLKLDRYALIRGEIYKFNIIGEDKQIRGYAYGLTDCTPV